MRAQRAGVRIDQPRRPAGFRTSMCGRHRTCASLGQGDPRLCFREQAEMCTTQRTGVRKNGPGRPACFRRRRAGARMPRWGRSRQRGHSGAHPLAAVVAYHTNWGNVIRHSRDLSSSPIPPDKSDSFRQLQKHKYKSSRFYTRGEKYR